MDIGERLKEARQEKDISLESLQDITKIQKRYLEAIEAGNFEKLPGNFYARAFIKEYALVVGLDPEELLEEFKTQIPAPDETENAQYTRFSRTQKEKEKNHSIFSFIPTIIVVILVIGIIVSMVYFLNKKPDSNSPVDEESNIDKNEFYVTDPDEKESKEEPKEDTEKESNEKDTNEDAQSDDSNTTLELVEEGTGNHPESIFKLSKSEDEVKIVVESGSKTWLEIQGTNGERLFYDSLTEETSPHELDVTGEEEVFFNIGYAADFTITINGTELEYPIDPTDVVTQKIRVKIGNEE